MQDYGNLAAPEMTLGSVEDDIGHSCIDGRKAIFGLGEKKLPHE
ncbi:hypothetical protein [Rufibacter immobilis]